MKFDEDKAQTNTPPALTSLGRKNGESPQSGTGGNDVRSIDQEENPHFNDNNSDNESALTLVPDHIDSPPRHSTRNRTERVLYPGHIVYGSEPFFRDKMKASETSQSSSSENFGSSRTAKSHKHMVQVLRMLSCNIDNEEADEPVSFKEAITRHDWPEWKMAMEREYNSLMENGTWELVSRPNGANIITSKWYFKLKKDRFGYILKYIARWVAHGYKQEEGIHYVKTFAAVVKPMSYKCLFAVGVKCGYRIRHMDVVTAILYDFLNKVIYMEQSHLFATELDKVCKLIKVLYGLKQALHVW